MAATYSIPAGQNLATFTPAPANGDIWKLQGNATLYNTGSVWSSFSMPLSLAIDGAGAGSTITLNNGAGNYGSFYSTSSTSLTLSNLTITGGSSATSAAIGVYSGGNNLTLDTSGLVTFSNNTITGAASGAALYANGSITINGGATFIGNTITGSGYGGAVFAQGALTFTDSTQTIIVRDNTASNGGGGLNSGANLTVAGGLILDHNVARGNGGGIRVVSGDVAIAGVAGNVTITKNDATGGGGAGGGIFTGVGNVSLGNASSTVTIGGSAADANAATKGGGIYSSGATRITGNTVVISYNRATAGNGGGVYSGGITTLSGTAITLSNNTASAEGGGIYSAGGVTVNGILTANANKAQNGSGGAVNAQAGGVTINGGISADGNTATDRGGVIHAAAGDIGVAGSNGGAVSLTNNSAVNGGGAFYAQTGNIALTGALGSVTITGNKTTTGSNSNGGALSAFAGRISFTPSSAGDVTITGNTAAGGGGAFYGKAGITFGPEQAGKLVVSDNVADGYGGGAFGTNGTNAHITVGGTYDSLLFKNNRATTGYGGVFTVVGGTGSNVTIDVITAGTMEFSDNDAKLNGGAINAEAASLKGSYGTIVFDGNLAETGHGGAIHANAVTIDATVSGALSLTDNRAGQYGGAINTYAAQILGNYGSILIDANSAGAAGGAIHGTSAVIDTTTAGSLTISDNIAGQSGGAIDTNGAQILGSYGSVAITGNTASTTGGAINSNSSNITVNATVAGTMEISGNKAEQGGAFAARSGNVAVSGNYGDILADGNKALTGNGGAFYASGNVGIANSSGPITLTKNTSAASGGAIYSGGTTTLTGAMIELSDNFATSNGGGIYSTGAATITGDLTANRNTAQTGSGGAIGAQAGGVTVTGSLTGNDNVAGAAGGGLYAAAGNIAVTDGVGMADNIATAGAGGAIAAMNGGVSLAASGGDVSLMGNMAASQGGAIYQGGAGDVAIGNASGAATISGNKAAADGGAVFSAGSTSLTGTAVTIVGNTATSGSGGAVYAARDFTMTVADATPKVGGITLVSGNTAGAQGGAIWAGNNVNLAATTGDITFTGNKQAGGANAIYLNNTSGSGIASFDTVAGRTITFFDPVESNALSGLVSVLKTGDGMLSFDGSKYSTETDRWSKVYGNTEVQAGTFEVANDAIYGVLAADAGQSAPTAFTSDSGTMVQGGVLGTIRADGVTLNGDLSIAGRHQPVIDYSVFNISTNALTLGGGAVYFNTYLNSGAEQNTDLLVLDLHGSATSGQSLISVTNTGGPGAPTIGDGIKLVETNGSGTTAGAFALGGRAAAGPYEYLLFYGGNAAAGGNADDQNWYLRNIVYIPDPENPGTPDDPNLVPVPVIRPEVPVSMVIPPLALEYGYAMLDTLHERVGETYLHASGPVTEERIVWCKDPARNFKCVTRVPVSTANNPNARDETRWAQSGWARIIGDRGLHQPDNFLRRGPNYDYTFWGIQAGLDLYAREQADGTLDKAGIYAGYGQITSDVKGQFGGKAGSVDMDAYTLGGYWTHFSPNGWYTDAVVQGTWYAADAKSVYGQQLKPDGFGILASLEGGYAFKLGSGWTLEPQAQIVYQNVSFDNARDAYGFVRFDDGDSLRGRLGVRLTKTWNMADEVKPRLLTTWLRANVWHEFLGKTKTSWGSADGLNLIPFNTYLGGTWGEIGAGVTAQVSDNINLFATGAYNRSLDGKGRQGWDGRIGMTVKW